MKTSTFALVSMTVSMLSSPSRAHDVWADGSEIPPWVKESCCGVADAHHLRLDQIHREAEGWRVEGYPYLIPDEKVLPSQDGEAWIFYSQYEGAYSSVYCFFYPASL